MDPAYRAYRRKQIEMMRAAKAIPSDEEGLNQIFNYYNSRGLIPRTTQRKKYKTIQQFLAAVQTQFNTVSQQNPDLSDTKVLNQALNNMAVKQRVGQTRGDIEIAMKHQAGLVKTGNVDYQGIPLKISGGQVKINNRAYMDDLPKPVRELLLQSESVQDVQAYEKAYKAEWKEMGDRAKAVLAKYGINFDRGHFTSNRAGGARSARAASLELSALNRMHGAEARQNLDALAQAGRSNTWIADYYLWKLSQANLSVLGADYLTDADFEAISQGADVNQLLLKNLQDVEQGNFQSLADKPSLVGQSLGEKTLPEALKGEYQRLLAKERETGINPAYETPSTLGPEYIRPETPPIGTTQSQLERVAGNILPKRARMVLGMVNGGIGAVVEEVKEDVQSFIQQPSPSTALELGTTVGSFVPGLSVPSMAAKELLNQEGVPQAIDEAQVNLDQQVQEIENPVVRQSIMTPGSLPF
tara:strand:+ start:60 stop:1469 length:1410 start_codon:yes stop_codon:yes gene_type:complete